MDGLPLFSQMKSAVQLLAGDAKGARKTQKNFSKQCIGVSQIRSGVEALSGDSEAALNTQREFSRNAYTTTQAIPVVGHGLGVGQYIVGNREEGDNSMKAATHTTGVIVGAVGGAVGGAIAAPISIPVGAIAGATAMNGVRKSPHNGSK